MFRHVADVDVRTIISAESKNRTQFKKARQIAEALDVSPEALLGEPPYDGHSEATDASVVSHWRIDSASWEPIVTVPNGLQWESCLLDHRFVGERTDRGKRYNLQAYLPDRLRPEIEASLTRHAEVCDRVGDQPNIARNRDSFPDDRNEGFWWVIDEWTPGRTLATYIQEGESDNDRLIPIMRDIALGLEGLHRAQVVRRELSPRFIWITESKAMLTDFELSKLLDGKPTVSNAHWPEDHYRAPEVKDSATATEQNDFYSWAMILAYVLTGADPSGPESARRVIKGSTLPKKIKDVGEACLKPVGKRPGGIREIIRVLDAPR